MIIMVPRDEKFYPTLGPQVCDFMERNLVFGPGDLRAQPLVLDDERRALIYRMYEVFPKRHQRAGRRRFQRCALSLAKGKAKTETSALIAACELHPDAPVRCTGFTKKGEPIGGPVEDPYIPFVAYTEEQSDELAYGALRIILENSFLKDDFDIGLERIERKKGDGKAVSLSSNPNSRDGARTTFCVMDETHRWTLPRLKQAHQTMLNNIPKRKLAQAWMLEITTAPEPGTGSVAEGTMDYARAVLDGRVRNASFFYFHRQASDGLDINKPDQARAAVIEASGPAAEWRDIDAIVSLLDDPETDRAYWERVWCNRLVQGSTQAFNVELWKTLASPREVKKRTLITLGFDGAMFHDSTGLVATDIATGYQWVAGAWECPPNGEKFDPPWQVPEQEVDDVVRELFDRFNVWRLYADPPYWAAWIAKWAGEFGKDHVIEWFTNRRRQMASALKNYETAMKTKAVSHDGDERMKRHVGNARRDDLPGWKDEKGQSLWLIRKERPDSPHKIDLTMAGALSWEARKDALTAGLLKVRTKPRGQLLVHGPDGWRPIDGGPTNAHA